MAAAVGSPLGATSAGATVHETELPAAPPEAIVVERPRPTKEVAQPLCVDKGYDNPTGPESVATSQDIAQSRRLGAEALDPNGPQPYPARRWVVERARAWLSEGRGLLGRDAQTAGELLGLLHLAWALRGMRRRAKLIHA